MTKGDLKTGTLIVTYRGILASIVEASKESYKLNDATLRSLLDIMGERHGYDFQRFLEDNPTYLVLVDGKTVDVDKDANMKLGECSRVDFVMTVSGGRTCC